MKETELPENIEKAAREQARSFGYREEEREYKELVETFKAGAEWMAHQNCWKK